MHATNIILWFGLLLHSAPALAGEWLEWFSEDFDTWTTGIDADWTPGYATDPWAVANSAGDRNIHASTDDNGGDYGSGGAIDNYLRYTAESFADFRLDVELTVSDNDAIGVVFRRKDAENFYLAFLTREEGPDDDADGGSETIGARSRIYEIASGNASQMTTQSLTTYGDTSSGAVVHDLRIECDGSSIRVLFDSAGDGIDDPADELFDVTDSTIDQGLIGLYCYDNGEGATDGCAFDDLVVSLWDEDEDGIPDQDDNCPDDANYGQGDYDEDDIGDACDDDIDGDLEDYTTDCDDWDEYTYTGAAETDDELDGETLCRTDVDGDGYGDENPAKGVEAGTDCDDSDIDINPGETETWYDGVDTSCHNRSDYDQDGDGDDCEDEHASCTGDDCDDTDPDTYVGAAPEEVSGDVLCMTDFDGDDWGDDYDETEPATGVELGTDCDDSDVDINPGETETWYDGVDTSCHGRSDYDQDGDGDDADAPDGTGTDCDDTDDHTYVGAAPEEVSGDTLCMTDVDGDDWGDSSATGDVTAGTDCNDAFDDTYPGAASSDSTSACMTDADDDEWGAYSPRAGATAGTDCDDDVSGQALNTYYLDDDVDGYGDDGSSATGCEAPSGYVDDDTDCDDDDFYTHPDATEICDGLVNTCTTVRLRNVEIDHDSDGYVECTFHGSGWDGDEDVVGGGDCEDTDTNAAHIYPGAAPLDHVSACMKDVDGDDYGDEAAGDWTSGTDCDDGDEYTYEGAAEICDGKVNECDGSLPTDETDVDGDGFVECEHDASGWHGATAANGGGDCDETGTHAADTYPGAAPEDSASACMKDVDDDDYGDDATGEDWTAGTDCDDGDEYTYEGAAEICDGKVNECDGSLPTDETDVDGDGFVECVHDASGWHGATAANGGGDCDETGTYAADTYPGAAPDDHLTACMKDVDDDDYGDDATGEAWTTGTDCDDDDALTYHGADEICDGIANDCGTSLPANEDDDDGDDYVECVHDSSGWHGATPANGGGDCDDVGTWAEWTYPGAAPEDHVSACMKDVDGDDYGDESVTGSVSAGTDCDDDDAYTYEGAEEICDGKVNECDGTLPDDEIDDDGDDYVECEHHGSGWHGATPANGGGDCDDVGTWAEWTYPGAAPEDSVSACMKDVDGDDYGDEAATGEVSAGTDCDDDDEYTYEGADEICDGLVNECDGTLPDDETDDDEDDYVECEHHDSGWHGETPANGGGDCDDTSVWAEWTYPGAAPGDLGVACMKDVDGDDYGDDSVGGDIVAGTDCDDDDEYTYEGAAEICDGLINDCGDDLPDDEVDDDGDDYVECSFHDSGWGGDSGVLGGGDCLDVGTHAASTFPGAAPDDSGTACMKDVDDDDYGDDATGEAWTPGTDCDDDDEYTYEGAAEICDGLVNECGSDLPADESDDDEDDYVECEHHDSGWHGETPANGGGDCDDGTPTTYPGADEYCNEADDDCDDTIDEDDALDALEWYEDSDGDTYGTPLSTTVACEQPAGYEDDDEDCDDDNPFVNPGADEVCNGIDDDCDLLVDVFAIDAPSWWLDDDGDGYGDPAVVLTECDQPSGYVDNDGDCDDELDFVYEGADEQCNEIDDDCDDEVDEDVVYRDWYPDEDEDGYGDAEATPINDCVELEGYVVDNQDCDDDDELINPDGVEVCDGEDNDCDGTIDEGTECYDDDGDGYTEQQGDCDDTTDEIGPDGVDGTVDGVDQNCDGIDGPVSNSRSWEEPVPELPGVGCGCTSLGASGGAGWVVGLVALVGLRRRSRRR